MTFFFVFLATILITRFVLYVHPMPSPSIGGFRLHHYMYGLALLTVGYALGSAIIFAVGLGLFVDELTYLLMGGKTHADNYSMISLLGTLMFIVLVFFLKDYIVAFI